MIAYLAHKSKNLYKMSIFKVKKTVFSVTHCACRTLKDANFAQLQCFVQILHEVNLKHAIHYLVSELIHIYGSI